MAPEARRYAEHLVYHLATARADQLDALRSAYFGTESGPTLEELEVAWSLVTAVTAALETGEPARWQRLKAACAVVQAPAPTPYAPRRTFTREIPVFEEVEETRPPLPFVVSTEALDEEHDRQQAHAVHVRPATPFERWTAPPASPVASAGAAPVLLAPSLPLEVSMPLAQPRATSPAPPLSLQEYALLCATREVLPERLPSVLAQHGLGEPIRLAEVEGYWSARCREDAALRDEHRDLVYQLRSWLEAQG